MSYEKASFKSIRQMKVIKEYTEPEGCQACFFVAAKLITILIIIAAIVYVNSGCVKVETIQRPDVYSLISEHYSLDTVLRNKYVLWQDTVFRAEEKRKLDTIKPAWQPICNANLEKVGIELRYYLKNGNKINSLFK